MTKIYIEADKLIMILIGVPVFVYILIVVVMDKINKRRKK